MILEVAILQIRAGLSAGFEHACSQAEPYNQRVNGYISHQLQRCVETTDKYILLVKWTTLTAHTEGFRQSAGYQDWKRLLHHFYDPFPVVEHYQSIHEDAG